MSKNKIINIAVIAHVDAGKSTLVDAFLHQSGTFMLSYLKVVYLEQTK